MDNVQEMLTEVLKQVYREYKGMSEIERLTHELEEALNRSDKKSSQMILDMRQKEMEEVSQAKRAVEELLYAMDSDLRADTERLLKGEATDGRAEAEAVKISDISRQMRNTLERIRRIDRVLNRRIAGKDSFYKD
ncbi:MAG TPA: hypothetical protein H9858_10575 [Candidatus Blautia stercoravium]|nr:hypothetical protein [Candidatus Blautia stercoravium]